MPVESKNAVLHFFESQYGKKLIDEHRELILSSCEEVIFKPKELVFQANSPNTKQVLHQRTILFDITQQRVAT